MVNVVSESTQIAIQVDPAALQELYDNLPYATVFWESTKESKDEKILKVQVPGQRCIPIIARVGCWIVRHANSHECFVYSDKDFHSNFKIIEEV